jgi:hypothetical protein
MGGASVSAHFHLRFGKATMPALSLFPDQENACINLQVAL